MAADFAEVTLERHRLPAIEWTRIKQATRPITGRAVWQVRLGLQPDAQAQIRGDAVHDAARPVQEEEPLARMPLRTDGAGIFTLVQQFPFQLTVAGLQLSEDDELPGLLGSGS